MLWQSALIALLLGLGCAPPVAVGLAPASIGQNASDSEQGCTEPHGPGCGRRGKLRAARRAAAANRTRLLVHIWHEGTMAGAALKLVDEGFRTHLHTMLVEKPEEAELIVWVVTSSDRSMQLHNEKPPPPLDTPVVVLDYSKTCALHARRASVRRLVSYFKVTWVRRYEEGDVQRQCYEDRFNKRWNIFPLAYSGSHLQAPNPGRIRDQSVTCTLSGGYNGFRDKVRLLVQRFQFDTGVRGIYPYTEATMSVDKKTHRGLMASSEIYFFGRPDDAEDDPMCDASTCQLPCSPTPHLLPDQVQHTLRLAVPLLVRHLHAPRTTSFERNSPPLRAHDPARPLAFTYLHSPSRASTRLPPKVLGGLPPRRSHLRRRSPPATADAVSARAVDAVEMEPWAVALPVTCFADDSRPAAHRGKHFVSVTRDM